VRRHQEDALRGVALAQVEELHRVPGAQDRHGAAGEHGAVAEREPRAVVERGDRDRAPARSHAPLQGAGVEGEAPGPVAEQDALGLAGGPGGVGDAERVVLVTGDGRVDGARAAQRGLVVAVRLPVGKGEGAGQAVVGGEHAGQRVVQDDGLGAGVPEDEGRLVRGAAGVDRDHRHAGLREAGGDLEVLHAVAHEHRDRSPRLRATRKQGLGDPAAPVVEAPVGQPAVPVDHGDRVGAGAGELPDAVGDVERRSAAAQRHASTTSPSVTRQQALV